MKCRNSDLEPELAAFLEHRPIERRLPPELRSRVLARSRAIAAGGAALPPALVLPLTVPLAPARSRVYRWVALAAAVAIAGVAIGAVAALKGRSARAPAMSAPERSFPVPANRAAIVDTPPGEQPLPPAEIAVPASRLRRAHNEPRGDTFSVELELLERARAAYTRGDFLAALPLIAEHARRYPKGRLAEQREALRVRSLLGSGRASEAHRAAAAFAARFPRSVLLPWVEGGSESTQP